MPTKVLWILGAFLITALVVWFMRRNDQSEPNTEAVNQGPVLDFETALDFFLRLCNEPEPPVAVVITLVAPDGRHRQVFVWIKPGCKPEDVDKRTQEVLNSTVSIEVFDEAKPSHLQTAVPAYHQFGHDYASWFASNSGSARHGSVINLQAIDPTLVLKHAFFAAVFKDHPKITLEVRAAVGRGNVAGVRGGTEHTIPVIGGSLDARPRRAFMPKTETVEQMPAVKAGAQTDGSMIVDMQETVAAPRQVNVSVPTRSPQQRR